MRFGKTIIFGLALTLVLGIASMAQTLTGVDGRTIDLSAARGKVVILSIGASWLPLSGKQADYTNMLTKRYAGKEVVVYFVATDSASAKSKNFASTEDIKKFAATNKLAVPVLRDPDGAAILKKYHVDEIPSFVVLDKNGNTAGEPFSGIDPKYDITVPISKLVDKLL